MVWLMVDAEECAESMIAAMKATLLARPTIVNARRMSPFEKQPRGLGGTSPREILFYAPGARNATVEPWFR